MLYGAVGKRNFLSLSTLPSRWRRPVQAGLGPPPRIVPPIGIGVIVWVARIIIFPLLPQVNLLDLENRIGILHLVYLALPNLEKLPCESYFPSLREYQGVEEPRLARRYGQEPPHGMLIFFEVSIRIHRH